MSSCVANSTGSPQAIGKPLVTKSSNPSNSLRRRRSTSTSLRDESKEALEVGEEAVGAVEGAIAADGIMAYWRALYANAFLVEDGSAEEARASRASLSGKPTAAILPG